MRLLFSYVMMKFEPLRNSNINFNQSKLVKIIFICTFKAHFRIVMPR